MVYRQAHWAILETTSDTVIERSPDGDTSELARKQLLEAAASFGYADVRLALVSHVVLHEEEGLDV